MMVYNGGTLIDEEIFQIILQLSLKRFWIKLTKDCMISSSIHQCKQGAYKEDLGP